MSEAARYQRALTVTIPVKTVSEANQRGHWAVRAKRMKAHREAAKWMVGSALIGRPTPQPPLHITLTRIAPRKLDSDNLAGSAKGVRDGIADALGINDGDERVTWEYSQASDGPKTYAVHVRIEAVRRG